MTACYLFIGVSCIFFLSSGCRKKTPESQLDSNNEQIHNLSQKAEKAALQAERYRDQAESKLAAIKEIAGQVMAQKNIATEESALQSAKTAAEASIRAAQSAGEQSEIAVQCAKEIKSLAAGSDKKTEDISADSSTSERADLVSQGFQKRAQTSYDNAKKTSEIAQDYLEQISRASKVISESKKSIESAQDAFSNGAQNRQSIEAAIEKLEDIKDALEDSNSCRSPEEIGQLLDQIETASDSLNEQLKSLYGNNDAGVESVLLPKIGGDESRSAGKERQVSVGEIPSLPVPPRIVRNPTGGFDAPELPDEPIPDSTGKWTQIEGGNGPDFLPGNYSISEFDFKVNGVLEVKRTFGKNNEMILRWRVGYEFDDKKTTLILGKDPKNRPSSASLSGFSIVEPDVSVKAAIVPFPAIINFEQIDDKRIKIGTKMYRKKES